MMQFLAFFGSCVDSRLILVPRLLSVDSSPALFSVVPQLPCLIYCNIGIDRSGHRPGCKSLPLGWSIKAFLAFESPSKPRLQYCYTRRREVHVLPLTIPRSILPNEFKVKANIKADCLFNTWTLRALLGTFPHGLEVMHV